MRPTPLLHACILAVLLTGAASATTVRFNGLADQVDRAEAILIGTVVATQNAPTDSGRHAYTLVTVSVGDALKGGADDDELVLRLDGGATATSVTRVAGMPEFNEGEQVLLFVQRNGQAMCPLVGWGLGKLRILPDPTSGEPVLVDAAGAALVGIEDGRWLRTAPLDGIAGDADQNGVPQGGVVKDIDTAAPTRWIPAPPSAATKVAPATEAIDALRSLIDARRDESSFLPGKSIPSADPTDLPDRMGPGRAPPAS